MFGDGDDFVRDSNLVESVPSTVRPKEGASFHPIPWSRFVWGFSMIHPFAHQESPECQTTIMIDGGGGHGGAITNTVPPLVLRQKAGMIRGASSRMIRLMQQQHLFEHRRQFLMLMELCRPFLAATDRYLAEDSMWLT